MILTCCLAREIPPEEAPGGLRRTPERRKRRRCSGREGSGKDAALGHLTIGQKKVRTSSCFLHLFLYHISLLIKISCFSSPFLTSAGVRVLRRRRRHLRRGRQDGSGAEGLRQGEGGGPGQERVRPLLGLVVGGGQHRPCSCFRGARDAVRRGGGRWRREWTTSLFFI